MALPLFRAIDSGQPDLFQLTVMQNSDGVTISNRNDPNCEEIRAAGMDAGLSLRSLNLSNENLKQVGCLD